MDECGAAESLRLYDHGRGWEREQGPSAARGPQRRCRETQQSVVECTMTRGRKPRRGYRWLVGVLTAVLTGSVLPPTPGVTAHSADDSTHVELENAIDSSSITPLLGLSLAADRSSAIPGDVLTYAAEVRNAGANLSLTGRYVAANEEDIQATVASYFDVVEFFSRTQKRWLPLAGFAAA